MFFAVLFRDREFLEADARKQKKGKRKRETERRTQLKDKKHKVYIMEKEKEKRGCFSISMPFPFSKYWTQGTPSVYFFNSPELSYRGSVLIRAAIWGLKRSIARGLFPISFSRFLFGDPGMNLSGRNLSGGIALSNTFNQKLSTGEV